MRNRIQSLTGQLHDEVEGGLKDPERAADLADRIGVLASEMAQDDIEEDEGDDLDEDFDFVDEDDGVEDDE